MAVVVVNTDAQVSGNTLCLEEATATVTAAWTFSGVATLASPVLTTPQINDTSSNHQYIFAVSELAADRTVTWPLLTGNDTLVFAAFSQTLTNKTLTSPVLTTPQINDSSADHQYVFAVSELAADRTVTWPLLTGNDTLVLQAHAATLTNKTIAMGSNTVTGTSAQMATAISDETGSGALCFATSPTLVTPTVASFANAEHDHTDSAGGGTLNASAIGAGNLAVARGGTGATTASAARSNLGLVIGTNVQAFDAYLDDIADLTDPGADRITFWDDSAGIVTWLTIGSGLTISGTTIAASGGLADIVDDTSPQLGGDLDANGNDIKIDATDKIYLDGPSGDNSYIWEEGGDIIEIVCGGTAKAKFKVAAVHFQQAYDQTTGDAADLHVNTAGQLLRSTSSLRYKQNVQAIDLPEALRVVSGLRGITYQSKPSVVGDDPDATFCGFIAEEVQELWPDQHSPLVSYDADERPDYVQYGRLDAYIVPVVQDLVARVKALEGLHDA